MNVILFPILIFVYWPGKIALWFEYMFPSPGSARATKRRYESPIVCVMYSMFLWFAFLIFIAILAQNPNHVLARQVYMSFSNWIDSNPNVQSIVHGIGGLLNVRS